VTAAWNNQDFTLNPPAVPFTRNSDGYDIEAGASPESPATISFTADIPGRFPVSEHAHGKAHHGAVLYLEVHP